jgi:hypothetical protein
MTTVFKKLLIMIMLSLTVNPGFAANLPAKNFSHSMQHDLFGYYIPVTPIKVGQYHLVNLSIGSPKDFDEYEQGKNKIASYAPIMFTFDDVTSRKLSGEMGEYYENSARILPTSYSLKGNEISFVGKDKQVGVVKFSGTIDVKTLTQEQLDTSKMATEKVIVKGDLTINGQLFKDVSFSWFAGD